MDYTRLKNWLKERKEDLSYWWTYDVVHTVKAPWRWIKHAYQRIKYGVSYRDAWNVDLWMSQTMPKILEFLDKNTISYSPRAVALHNKLCEIDDGLEPVPDDQKDNNSEDFLCPLFHKDIQRIGFLFNEYDKDRCSIQNPFDPEIKDGMVDFIWHPSDDPKRPEYKTLEIGSNQAQKDLWKKWSDEDQKINLYRIECLHKAIKMLDVYIEELWD